MAKHNPNQFHWPILGHSQIKHYLQSCLVNASLSHAYLFYGPKYTGKFLMARYLSSSLLCQSTTAKKPCQNCPVCEQLDKNLHPDIDIIAREVDKKNITIGQIRNLQHKLSLRSFLTSYKIAIIDEADSLNEEAANALLKTLEEPTPQTIFILIAENKENLPSTITSRCQAMPFNLIPSFQIENWLLSRGQTKHQAKTIARFANGRPGLANLLLNEGLILNQHHELLHKLIAILKSDINDRLMQVTDLVAEREASDNTGPIDEVLDAWLTFFRDIYLYQQGCTFILNLGFEDKIKYFADKYSPEKIIRKINWLNYSKKLLKQSINTKLVLENLSLVI